MEEEVDYSNWTTCDICQTDYPQEGFINVLYDPSVDKYICTVCRLMDWKVRRKEIMGE